MYGAGMIGIERQVAVFTGNVAFHGLALIVYRQVVEYCFVAVQTLDGRRLQIDRRIIIDET